MKREDSISLIGTNIKNNSNRVSPNKTTGPMLKEVLLALANQDPYAEEFLRTNPETGLSDIQYIDEFIGAPDIYGYQNIQPNKYLDGNNGNFFMSIFRALAASINTVRDMAFDREAKFIVGKQVTNAELEGTNWFVADGTNNTDDMRGRVAVGGGQTQDAGNKTFTLPYTTKGGRYDRRLLASNLPAHKHDIDLTLTVTGDTGGNPTQGHLMNSNDSTLRPGFKLTGETETYGSTTPTPIELMQPYITGTWIQYVTPDLEDPSVPLNLAVSNITGTSFTLTWDPSTDDTGILGYEVFIDNLLIGGVTPTNYKYVTALVPNNTYEAKVRAVDTRGKRSDFSNIVQATTLDQDVIPPTTPSNLQATANPLPTDPDRYRVSLSWNRSDDNVQVSSYVIERRITPSTIWSLYDTVPQVPEITPVIYHIPSNDYLSELYDYTVAFRVRAVDINSNFSSYSNIASVIIPAAYYGGGDLPDS